MRLVPAAEVESSRTFLTLRTHFEVLGLGLEALSLRTLPCPRLEDSTFFEPLKLRCKTPEILRKIWQNLLFVFLFCSSPEKFFWRSFSIGDNLRLCPWPRPRALLSLASRGSVLWRAVLGFGFFCLSLALASSLASSTLPLPGSVSFPPKVFGPPPKHTIPAPGLLLHCLLAVRKQYWLPTNHLTLSY